MQRCSVYPKCSRQIVQPIIHVYITLLSPYLLLYFSPFLILSHMTQEVTLLQAAVASPFTLGSSQRFQSSFQDSVCLLMTQSQSSQRALCCMWRWMRVILTQEMWAEPAQSTVWSWSQSLMMIVSSTMNALERMLCTHTVHCQCSCCSIWGKGIRENLIVMNDYFSSPGTLTCNVASVNILNSISLSCDTVPPGIINVQCFLNNGLPIDCTYQLVQKLIIIFLSLSIIIWLLAVLT